MPAASPSALYTDSMMSTTRLLFLASKVLCGRPGGGGRQAPADRAGEELKRRLPAHGHATRAHLKYLLKPPLMPTMFV